MNYEGGKHKAKVTVHRSLISLTASGKLKNYKGNQVQTTSLVEVSEWSRRREAVWRKLASFMDLKFEFHKVFLYLQNILLTFSKAF